MKFIPFFLAFPLLLTGCSRDASLEAKRQANSEQTHQLTIGLTSDYTERETSRVLIAHWERKVAQAKKNAADARTEEERSQADRDLQQASGSLAETKKDLEKLEPEIAARERREIELRIEAEKLGSSSEQPLAREIMDIPAFRKQLENDLGTMGIEPSRNDDIPHR